MMKKIIFIKFGGSIITDKSIPLTPNLSTIESLSKQFGRVAKEMSDEHSFVIGNGAGSFGHYFADKYDLVHGIHTKDQIEGFSTEQYYDTDLNHLIVKNIMVHHPLIQAFHPSSMFLMRGGKFKKCLVEPIINALTLGITPSIYGNIVTDEQSGCCILSTETIFHELIKQFSRKKIQVAKVIYLTSIDGFQREDGSVIQKVDKISFLKNEKYLYNTKGFDVTGGMRQKITEALKLASLGIQTHIVNGNEKDVLTKILLKNEGLGTTVS
ncbi:MAG: isopentenyl phosphate kinase [Microgenomates group bacterium]|jgi:isopentenyl phosphate kinase